MSSLWIFVDEPYQYFELVFARRATYLRLQLRGLGSGERNVGRALVADGTDRSQVIRIITAAQRFVDYVPYVQSDLLT